MRKWTRQPPAGTKIDWKNPISKKLGFLWIGPHTGGGYGKDLVSDTFGQHGDPGNPGTWENRISSKGHIQYTESTASNSDYLHFPDVSFTAEAQNCFALARSIDSRQYWRTIAATYTGTGLGEANMEGLFYPIGTTTQNVSVYDGGVTQTWAGDGIAVTNGSWHTHFWQKKFGVSNNGYYYLDGINKGTDDGVAYNLTGNTVNRVVINANTTWGDEGSGCETAFVAIFTELLTDAEVKSLHENPWQVLESPLNFALADPLPQTRSLTVEVPWTKQPPPGTKINWKNPLTNGLSVAVYPTGGAYFADAVSGRVFNQDARAGETGDPVQTFSNMGRGLSWSNNTDGDFQAGPLDASFGPRQLFTQNDITIATLYQIEDETIGHSRVPFGILRDDSDREQLLFYHSHWSLYCRFETAFNLASASLSGTGAEGVTGDIHFAASVLHNGAGDSSVVDLFLQNKTQQVTQYTSATSQPTQDYTQLNANADSITMAQKQGVSSALGLAWDRPLSRAELDTLAINPWQIFKPQELHVPIEYQELTFDETAEERLFWIPQEGKGPP